MFRDEFQAELDYLVQLCEELGRRQPALAPMLGRGADLHVSRLVEGLAFSFARLRQRLNDDLPEVIHPVVDNLCPELLRPIPSGTIIELSPTTRTVAKLTVSAGSSFGARPMEGVTCVFRSVVDCEVSPWSLRGVEVSTDRRALKLVLELFDGAELATAVPKSLRLFLALPLAAALDARRFLLAKTLDATVRAAGSSGSVRIGKPQASLAVRARLGAQRALTPIADAMVALREYFVHPQLFAFVELPDFEAVAELGPKAEQLEIELAFSDPLPRGVAFDVTSFVLHAVPVLNVFRVPKFTIPLAGDKRRCNVRFGPELPGAEVYAIEGVSVVSRNLRSTPITPWARFFSPPFAGAREAIRYEVVRAPSIVGNRADVAVTFSGEDVGAFLADKTAAELDLLATNGERAASLGAGDVSVSIAGSPTSVSFRNLTGVTRSAAPATAEDRLWRCLRALKASVAALAEREMLSELLAILNVPALERWPGAKPDARGFAPLMAAELDRRAAASGAEIDAGAAVAITVDERAFLGPGDAQLLGELLVPLFVAAVSRDEWIELVLRDASGATIDRYPRTYGRRRGL